MYKKFHNHAPKTGAGKWKPTTRLIAWATKSSKENKGDSIDHAALARDKQEVTLSFASGQLAMRNMRIVTPD